MTAILAIETSGSVGSIALAVDGRIQEREIATPREQTGRLLPLVDELLRERGLTVARLDAVAFGRGPGSFTGLRIAAAVAQGLAMSARLPVLPVSSLAAVAQRALDTAGVERSLVCVDARMGEVYWGAFEARGGLAQPIGAERLGAPERVDVPAGGAWTALGSGFRAHAEALGHALGRAAAVVADIEARARDLLPQALEDWRDGRSVRASAALPTYLRDDTAWRRTRP